MYLRRKVFSSYIDEYGEERYYSEPIAIGPEGNPGAVGMEPAKEGFFKRGKAWLKKTYGKGAKHRGRNIAITAAVPVAAAGIGLGVKAARNKKSSNNNNE